MKILVPLPFSHVAARPAVIIRAETKASSIKARVSSLGPPLRLSKNYNVRHGREKDLSKNRQHAAAGRDISRTLGYPLFFVVPSHRLLPLPLLLHHRLLLCARARYYCCRRCRVSKEASTDSARKGKIRKMGHWLLGARGDPERIIHVYVCICIFNAVIIAALLLGADREPSHYILYIYYFHYRGERSLFTWIYIMIYIYI